MKTSIKILLGLLLVIFMIPTVFFMAYGIKIKNKDFKPYDEAALWSRVDIGPGRFIKISSPDKEVLDCKLTLSDKPHYMVWAYGQGGDDSVNIHQQLDTLFITYIDMKSRKGDDQLSHRSVEIFVSEWQQLQINGASVSIDSSFGDHYPLKQISMTNSNLDFGVADENQDEDQKKVTTSAAAANSFMSNLQLNAINSKLAINKNYRIGRLALGFTGGELFVQKGGFVDTVSGFVSVGTHLNVDGAFLSNMKGLQVK